MLTINKQSKDVSSYILIAIWLIVIFFVKSIFWMASIGILLVIISIIISVSFYKSLGDVYLKKRYLTQKLVLMGSVLFISALYLFIMK